MVTWRIVDDDVECLHVERNPTMTCSGSHLYKFYRYTQLVLQGPSCRVFLLLQRPSPGALASALATRIFYI
jgi:hypothetical protein